MDTECWYWAFVNNTTSVDVVRDIPVGSLWLTYKYAGDGIQWWHKETSIPIKFCGSEMFAREYARIKKARAIPYPTDKTPLVTMQLSHCITKFT